MSHRWGKGAEVLNDLRGVWRDGDLSVEAKIGVFEGLFVSVFLYDSLFCLS